MSLSNHHFDLEQQHLGFLFLKTFTQNAFFQLKTKRRVVKNIIFENIYVWNAKMHSLWMAFNII